MTSKTRGTLRDKPRHVGSWDELETCTILYNHKALIRGIINPSDSMSSIANGLDTLIKHANSTPLKIGAVILSAIPMAILAPFALVEKSIDFIAAPFKALGNWLTKSPPSPELDGQITSPLPSEYLVEKQTANSYSKMAGLVNAKVAQKINENTFESGAKNRTAMDILTQFEIDQENTDKVVTLNSADFDTLNKYIREKNSPKISERFRECCDTSLQRAHKLSPVKPEQMDAIVKRKKDRLRE